MKIKYEKKRGNCVTPCPHGEKISATHQRTINVGSFFCAMCDFYKGIDNEKQEVECGKE